MKEALGPNMDYGLHTQPDRLVDTHTHIHSQVQVWYIKIYQQLVSRFDKCIILSHYTIMLNTSIALEKNK